MQYIERYNVRVHRATANKLNIENRATRGSVCNALLCRGSVPHDDPVYIIVSLNLAVVRSVREMIN